MTNFLVYMLGVIIVVCALAYGAHLLGVSDRWIGIGAAAGAGLGIMAAIVKTRRPQSSGP
jgi:positive regulator of sigma E activity